MRGCLQITAGIVAVIFLATAVFALFAYNLIVVAADREAMKQMLGGLDAAVRQATPALIAEAARQQALARGITNLPIDEQQLAVAVATVIPPGWIDAQADAAIDGVYDFLETGDPGAAEVAIDTRPLLESLRGPAGRDMVTAVLTNLPTCTDTLPQFNLESGDFPHCVPPQMPTEVMAAELHSALVTAMDNNPQIIGSAGVVRVPLFGADSPTGLSVEQQTQLARLQRNFMLARSWGWTLWLLPLACLLLILLLTVRSLPEWGHWWGWPLIITAAIALFLCILAPAVLAFISRTAVSPTAADPLALPLRHFMLQLLTAVADHWLMRVYLQAGIMLAAGVGLVVLSMLNNQLSITER